MGGANAVHPAAGSSCPSTPSPCLCCSRLQIRLAHSARGRRVPCAALQRLLPRRHCTFASLPRPLRTVHCTLGRKQQHCSVAAAERQRRKTRGRVRFTMFTPDVICRRLRPIHPDVLLQVRALSQLHVCPACTFIHVHSIDFAFDVCPHTSHFTPRTSHLALHTSHVTHHSQAFILSNEKQKQQ